MTSYVKAEPKYDWRKPLPILTLAELFPSVKGLPNNNSVRIKGFPGLKGTKLKRRKNKQAKQSRKLNRR